MAPSRRKGSSKAAAAAAARRQWKVGDLVLAKVKGFPAWPATVSEPEKWGYPADWKKVLVYFFGTQQIAFCNHADVEAFTEEKKQSLLGKRHGKGADFMRAVQEIIDCYELKIQEQANDMNSGTEATPAIVGNSLESSTNLQLQETCKDSAEASNSLAKRSPLKVKSDSDEGSVPKEEAKDFFQVNSLVIKPEVEEVVTGRTVEEPPIMCTYSLRKKSGNSQLENSTTWRRAPSLRRSRSSLRGESSRTRSLMMPTKDGENVHEVSLRRGGRVRKTSDAPKGDDMGSIDSVQNGSTDDNGSEIVSTRSEPLDLKEDSAVDSCCKRPNEEAMVECVDGDVELKKGLDMHISAVFVKKKRKPNKKRAIREAADPDPNMVTGATVEAVNTAEGNLENVTTESFFKDDGDEHLPLLKRARVRMSKLESVEEHNKLLVVDKYPVDIHVEDKHPVEVANGSNTPHDKHVAPDMTKEHLHDIDDIEQCMMHDASDDLDVGPSVRKEAPDGVFLSEDCTESLDTRSCLWTCNRSQLGVSSARGEAALPPSKRLHRAFEAMSANAVQDCPSNGVSSSNELPSLDCSHSSRISPVEAVVNIAGNELGKQISEPIVNLVSSISSSALLDQKKIETEIMEEVDICEKPTEKSENLVDLQHIAKVGHVDERDDPSSSAFNVTSDLEMNISRNLSHVCKASELSLKFNQPSDPSACSAEKVNVNCGEYCSKSPEKECANVTEESAPERHDTSEETQCSQPEIKNAADSHIHEQQAHQQTLGSDCEVDHLKPQYGDISQTSSSMSQLNKERDVQLASDGNFMPCGNGDSYSKDISSASPSGTDRANTPAHVSPVNASYCQPSTSSSDMITQNNGSCSPVTNSHYKKPTSDSADGVITQNNGSCSPVTISHHKKPRHDTNDVHGKLESSSPKQKPGENCNNYSEARAALSSFEAVLGALTRTKESIGRATRIAIDCAKLGFAIKAVERLVRTLEDESSLSRRVDLFFLLDSIIQSSRGLKGDVGGASYPIIIQRSLQRVIGAVAPPGSAAHENRRQCMKVLRLWMERRVFPDPMLRHYMRELDNHNVSSANGAYSRRSARTERAFDDPVREMEGMLVDEYGSNSSFQLPGFCMPRMLKDGDDGSDSDGSFEAVTPERSPETPHNETASSVGKHRHILQDVDGELEMEDVAPTEEEISSLSNIVSSSENPQNAGQQHFPLPMAPPALPDQSTPSIPVSSLAPPPPPPPPPHSRPHHNVASTSSDSNVNGLDQNSHDNRNNLGRSKHVQASDSTSNSMHSRRSMENGQHSDGSRNSSRPPYGAPNHYSYGEHRGRPHREGPSYREGPPCRDGPPHREGPGPYSSRYSHNRFNGNYYNNHDRMKPPPYEVRDNWRFSDPYSGPRYPEKSRSSSSSCSGPPYDYDCPPCEPPRFPNHHGWSHPPRPMGHRNHMPFRPHYEGDGYWPPR